jgi:hypothetical protein
MSAMRMASGDCANRTLSNAADTERERTGSVAEESVSWLLVGSRFIVAVPAPVLPGATGEEGRHPSSTIVRGGIVPRLLAACPCHTPMSTKSSGKDSGFRASISEQPQPCS